jgi:hypothetical protein
VSGPAQINLHIERLVLDGASGFHDSGGAVRAAVEAELVRLFTEDPSAIRLSRSFAVPALRGDPVAASPSPQGFGAAIAASVHGAVTR